MRLQIFFYLNRLIFSASDRLARNFPAVQNGPEKRKNFIQLNWPQNHFYYLKLVPIDSALNSASGKLI